MDNVLVLRVTFLVVAAMLAFMQPLNASTITVFDHVAFNSKFSVVAKQFSEENTALEQAADGTKTGYRIVQPSDKKRSLRGPARLTQSRSSRLSIPYADLLQGIEPTSSPLRSSRSTRNVSAVSLANTGDPFAFLKGLPFASGLFSDTEDAVTQITEFTQLFVGAFGYDDAPTSINSSVSASAQDAPELVVLPLPASSIGLFCGVLVLLGLLKTRGGSLRFTGRDAQHAVDPAMAHHTGRKGQNTDQIRPAKRRFGIKKKAQN